MIGIKYDSEVELKNTIQPSGISIREGRIFIFDRINDDEGRLYLLDKQMDLNLVMETDEAECFFGRDGLVYLLNIDEGSTLEAYDYSGNKVKNIDLKGMVYSVDIDSEGRIYAITRQEDEMAVWTYDASGSLIRPLHSRNMPILSAIYGEGEYIYISGFSKDTPSRIEKINELSYIKTSYEIGDETSKSVVTRMQRQGSLLAVASTSKHGDCIEVIDMDKGSGAATCLDGVDMGDISDMQISDDSIYILTGDKKLHIYSMVYDCEDAAPFRKCLKTGQYQKVNYGYLYYLIYIVNLPGNYLRFAVRGLVPFALLIMLYFQLNFPGGLLGIRHIEDISTILGISILIASFGVTIKSFGVVWKKQRRVDSALDIYRRIESVKSLVLGSSLFLGVIVYGAAFLLMYGGDVKGPWLFGLSFIPGAAASAAVYALGIFSAGKLGENIDNIEFELLRFENGKHVAFDNVGKQVKNLRRLGIERYRIRIALGGRLGKGIIKFVKRWSSLRNKITGDLGVLESGCNYIVFDLNLKNRDIKYSRLSVIEDFICYINNIIAVDSVIVEKADEHTGKL
jgi:hypothetical protein